MKAIVQTGYGSPDRLELREIEKPVVEDGRVLVRVRAASLNAADLHLLRRVTHVVSGLMGRPVPRVRGGDVAGVVEAIGGSVTRFEPGDPVFGAGPGTLAEYTAAAEDRLAPMPRGLTFEQAATLSGAGCTALQGLRDRARVRPGERVLVHGAGGGVGTFAVQIAKSLGAHVTAVSRGENLDLLRSLGADEVVDYTKEDFTRRGEHWDVVFDIGADRPVADCLRVLTAGGRLVHVGAPKALSGQLALMWRAMSKPGPRSRRIAFIARVDAKDLIALKDLAEAGTLVPVIERTYALSEAADAMRHLGTGRARGKLVISIP